MFAYMDCCITCGFLYIILVRFSLTTVYDAEDPEIKMKPFTPPSRIEDVNRFLERLNNEFKLADRLKYMREKFTKADLTKVFLLVLIYSPKPQKT